MADSDEQQFLDGLPRERVAKAITDSGGSERGRLLKVIYLDEKGEATGEWASSQLPEDPFEGRMQGLMEPPYPLEQLVYLAETHPVHSSAMEQKAVDICGKGWAWEPEDEDNADEGLRDELEKWFQGLAPEEEDVHEILHAVWLDVETVGWGLLELVRDPSGVLKRVYHVPGHTVRAHKDGFRLCQIRQQRKVWFRRWGSVDEEGNPIEVDAKSGSMKTVREPANDLFVIKRPSRRSTWYGIPGYVSAVGWIVLALSARDDNLMYFNNRREPRWAIILSNIQDDPNIEEDLRRAFVVDLKQPHRNLIVPITGNGKVDFQQLSNDAKDGTFDKLSDRADKAIMIAHRCPAERLANSQTGALGGDSTLERSRIYKDGVVAPGQGLLNKRLNRLIDVEHARSKDQEPAEDDGQSWRLRMQDLDLQDDKQDLDMTVIAFKNDLLNLGEARARLKLGPLMQPVLGEPDGDGVRQPTDEEERSPLNELLYTQLPGVSKGGDPGSGLDVADTGLDNEGDVSLIRDPAVALLLDNAQQLLQQSRESNDRLEELARDRPRS